MSQVYKVTCILKQSLINGYIYIYIYMCIYVYVYVTYVIYVCQVYETFISAESNFIPSTGSAIMCIQIKHKRPKPSVQSKH